MNCFFQHYGLFVIADSIYGAVTVQAMPVLTFANQSGLDMLETTLAALREMTMDKVLDCDQGRKGKRLEQYKSSRPYQLAVAALATMLRSGEHQ